MSKAAKAWVILWVRLAVKRKAVKGSNMNSELSASMAMAPAGEEFHTHQVVVMLKLSRER